MAQMQGARERQRAEAYFRVLDSEQVGVVLQAMDQYQRLLVLLEDWEHESARIISGPDRPTRRSRGH